MMNMTKLCSHYSLEKQGMFTILFRLFIANETLYFLNVVYFPKFQICIHLSSLHFLHSVEAQKNVVAVWKRSIIHKEYNGIPSHFIPRKIGIFFFSF